METRRAANKPVWDWMARRAEGPWKVLAQAGKMKMILRGSLSWKLPDDTKAFNATLKKA